MRRVARTRFVVVGGLELYVLALHPPLSALRHRSVNLDCAWLDRRRLKRELRRARLTQSTSRHQNCAR